MAASEVHEVLIKVRAASVNHIDWQVLRWKSLFLRLSTGGLHKPKNKKRSHEQNKKWNIIDRDRTEIS